MGLLEIIRGEQPGFFRSLKNFENLGQFGEYSIDFALTNHNLTGDFTVLRNLYIPSGNRTIEIDLLLIHEKGIFVFESKNYSGWIFGSSDQQQWTQCLRGGEKHRFYNPVRQNEGHIRALSRFLGIPSDAFVSYIVFSERCVLKDVPDDTPSVIIIRRPNMLRHLRKALEDSPVRYTHGDIEQMKARLEPLTHVPEEAKEQHVVDIKTKCPVCGSELVQRSGRYGIFLGCSAYPRCRYTRNIE